MNKKNETVFRLAFCAVCAGLSTAALWAGAVTGLFDLTALLFAGTVTVVMRTEAGERLSWVSVAVTFVLAAVFLPEKLLALGYIAVAGAYPLLLRFLPKRGVPLVVSRLIIGSALAGIYFLLIKFIFTGAYDAGEARLIPFILAGGVVLFFIYDRWLDIFARFYEFRLRPRLRLGRRKK